MLLLLTVSVFAGTALFFGVVAVLSGVHSKDEAERKKQFFRAYAFFISSALITTTPAALNQSVLIPYIQQIAQQGQEEYDPFAPKTSSGDNPPFSEETHKSRVR